MAIIKPTFDPSEDIVNDIGDYPASSFCAYIFDDFKQDGADSEGKIAVGGYANLSNMTVAGNLPITREIAYLVVQEKLDFYNWCVNYGETEVKDSFVLGSNSVNYQVNNSKIEPRINSRINIKGYESYYQRLSVLINMYEVNGTNNLEEWGRLTFVGVNESVNIFSVNGENIENSEKTFENLNEIVINAPTNSTIIILVTGNNIKIPNYGIRWEGADINSKKSQIIWNFYNTAELKINCGFMGTVLAPKATLVMDPGYINGTAIVKSAYLTNNSEFHNYLFDREFPELILDEGIVYKKIADKEAVYPGEVLTYTLAINNNGKNDASNIVIKDRIDINTTYINDSIKLTIVNQGIYEVVLPQYRSLNDVPVDIKNYAIVPDLATIPCIDNENEKNREIEVHIDEILKSGSVAIIKLAVLIGGEYEDDINKLYGLNNPINISLLNANNIKNKMGIGYSISIDGMDIPEARVDVPDFDNSEDKDRIEEVKVKLKYAKLLVFKDVFRLNNNEYIHVDDNKLLCGDKICYLITLKNYGNIDAVDVSIKDLMKKGLDISPYKPKYNLEEDVKSLIGEHLETYTVKIYDYNSNSQTKYVTGKNNRIGEAYLWGYPCVNENVANEARRIVNKNNGEQGILVLNSYIELLKGVVPARKKLIDGNSSLIKLEKKYDKYSSSCGDNVNDGIVGVLELRIYYTINCDELEI